MKQKTIKTIVVFTILIIGFILSVSLCNVQNIEGLDMKMNNVASLNRGEYIDKVSYLKSQDGSYDLRFSRGMLSCRKKMNNKWKRHWNMNANGKQMMLLNKYGLLQLKASNTNEYIPITDNITGAESVILTSYGTLELKSLPNGKGETLWTYPSVEGFDGTPDDADNELNALMKEVDTERNGKLKGATLTALNNYLTGDSKNTNFKLTEPKLSAWNALFEANKGGYVEGENTYTPRIETKGFGALVNSKITSDVKDEHNILIDNAQKMRRLRNNLDNRLQVLNQLGDSHIIERKTQLNSTIFISLGWTAIASALVYYTLTQ